ncbi:MAG: multicopper oxidase domain-containing protein [Nitrospirae bacterium]|nr:multicopper oxidase domain-containing protein [Nitrospirota bacterium]
MGGEDITSPGPTITVRVGEPVTITFKNVTDLLDLHVLEPHDFVIVAAMDNPEVLTKLRVDPLWGAETEWLPSGEQQTITFTPDTPGSYFYLCTNTDHADLGMWGSFIVEE